MGLDSRCSGFAFDNATQITTFKSTTGGSTIDVLGSDEVCNLPTGVEWVRNSGKGHSCYRLAIIALSPEGVVPLHTQHWHTL